MTKEEYNHISLMYQFLTKRFDYTRSYYFDKFYKCYNPEHFGVRGENLNTLKKFENLTLRDVYTVDHINSNHYGDNYLDSKIVLVEEERICVLPDLGFIFIEILTNKLKDGIKEFVKKLNQLNEKYGPLIKKSEDGNFIKMRGDIYDEFKPQFDTIENFPFIFHFFAHTRSHIMYRNMDNYLEISLYKVDKILSNLDKINFDVIDI